MLKFPLSMLLAVVGVLAAAAPSVHAQISPQPRDPVDTSVMLEDPTDAGHTSTITTSFTSASGVNSVSVTCKNETTGETTTSEHEFDGAHSGTYQDHLQNTKVGDKVKMTKVYHLANGTTSTVTSHGTIG